MKFKIPLLVNPQTFFFPFFIFLFISLLFLLQSACITISAEQYPKMTVMATFVADGHKRKKKKKK